MTTVLHVIPSLAGGGAERQLQYLGKSLVSMGVEVHIAYLYEGGANLGDFQGVVLHKLQSRSNYDFRLLVQLYFLIKKVNPDIVQSWLIQSDILSAIVCFFSRRKWVVRESNAPSLRKGSSRKFFLRKLLIRFSAGIVSNSSAGLSYWQGVYPQKSNVLIENGFPIFDIEKSSENQFPKQLEEKFGPYVLFVGRLEEQKNVYKIVESMAAVKSPLKLLLCGDGSLSVSLKARAKDLGLDTKISFMGKTSKDDVYQLMGSAKGIILNSHFEGFPNVAVEAMICNCPIILSDIPPHRAILSDDSATFIDKESVNDIAKSIDSLLKKPESKRIKAANAYSIAKGLSLESMAKKYGQLYSAIRDK